MVFLLQVFQKVVSSQKDSMKSVFIDGDMKGYTLVHLEKRENFIVNPFKLRNPINPVYFETKELFGRGVLKGIIHTLTLYVLSLGLMRTQPTTLHQFFWKCANYVNIFHFSK